MPGWLGDSGRAHSCPPRKRIIRSVTTSLCEDVSRAKALTAAAIAIPAAIGALGAAAFAARSSGVPFFDRRGLPLSSRRFARCSGVSTLPPSRPRNLSILAVLAASSSSIALVADGGRRPPDLGNMITSPELAFDIASSPCGLSAQQGGYAAQFFDKFRFGHDAPGTACCGKSRPGVSALGRGAYRLADLFSAVHVAPRSKHGSEIDESR